MMHRALRTLFVALLMVVALHGHEARAATLQRYTNKQYGYSFAYPASWKAGTAAGTTDTVFRSPDGATTFAVQVSGGTPSAAGVRSVATAAVRSLLNVAQGAALQVTVSTPTIAGAVATQAEARGTVSGAHRFSVARAVGYDGYLYIFLGFGPTPPSISVDAPAIALHNILSSIVLTPVRQQYSAPAVHFGMFYPKGWKRVSYPDLGKIVEDGPAGAVIFADYGRGAANTIDLRFLLLQNVVLMGKIQGQEAFTALVVDGTTVQAVQVNIKDKQGRTLEATVADASFNGYNYVFGGAAPKGSAQEQAVLDTIGSATMRPHTLPPDTGAFMLFAGPDHRYTLRRPAAWILNDDQPGIDAAFSARDGDLTLLVERRTGTLTGVLTQLTGGITASAGSGVKKSSVPGRLGALSGQEVVITQTIIPKQTSNGTTTPALVQQTHILAAASGSAVYVLSWSFYTDAPDAAALQKLARRVAGSFMVTAVAG
jgi:hypothetical protein